MSDRDTRQALMTGLIVALVCSVLVSSAAVLLQPMQEKNRRLDQMRNILRVSGRQVRPENLSPRHLMDVYRRSIEHVVVDMERGRKIETAQLPASLRDGGLDPSKMEQFPGPEIRIPREDAVAGMDSIPAYIQVYFVSGEEGRERIILPVYGKGLWSTMFGFLALDMDLKTVKGITFYEHGETPGLGGEITNPDWQEQWVGTRAYGEDWKVLLQVGKGALTTDIPGRVDGISGATLTSRGVSQMMQFWLGPRGYRPYLMHIREVSIE